MTHPDVSSQRLRWTGLTDRGKVRPNNEDTFLGLQFDAEEVRFLGRLGESSMGHNDFVFAVSDGMGGYKAGEFASRTASEKITRLLPRSYKQAAAGIDIGAPEVLGELFDQIHRSLLFLSDSYEECRGMGTTLSLCWFRPGWMHFAHIGDSRIYYFPALDGSMRQLSQDDTHVGWLFRQGKISEREARNHPGRSSLQKALGAGNRYVDPQTGSVGCEPGDLFLLCTDGVIDGLFDAQIHELLRPPPAQIPARSGSPGENPARSIVQAALERSGRDNTTALVVEVLPPAPAP